jgi:flagellar biosynthesis/type III secretory pathway protein FliH
MKLGAHLPSFMQGREEGFAAGFNEGNEEGFARGYSQCLEDIKKKVAKNEAKKGKTDTTDIDIFSALLEEALGG